MGPPPDEPSPAALLLHGLTGTPRSMAGLDAALAAAGFATARPTLPGHGTSPDDLAVTGWADWTAAAEAAFRDLAATHGRVLLVGLSMGGSLACWLAARHPTPGLVVVNPFIDPPAASFRELLRTILDQGHRSVPGIGGDVARPDAATEAGYDELPVRPLLSLCEGLDGLLGDLGRITCPTLLFTSRHDHVVPPVSSDILAGALGGPVERVRLERSYHVATLDHDAEAIEARTVDFARAVAARRGPGSARSGRARPG